MRALWFLTIFGTVCAFAAVPEHESASPDGRWLVLSHCEDKGQSDSCSIVLSRRADGKAFFTHRTFPRYIKAVWSTDSSKCVLVDAPDNANSCVWLFRVKGREVAIEQLDYEKISADVEAAVPSARRHEPAVTRSGIEKIEWPSSAELRLNIIYNNVPVVVVADVAEPNTPKFRVLPHNEP